MLPRRDEEVYVQEWNSGTTIGRGVGREEYFPQDAPHCEPFSFDS